MKNLFKINMLNASIFACFLVGLRFWITFELYYFFLIWNLFLALVPLVLAYILNRQKAHISISILLIGLWILFLPNSFYVITDLIHLKNSNFLLYDTVLITYFAVVCGQAGFLSMKEVTTYFRNKVPGLDPWILNIFLLFLSAFGIFLGRFLRYNSWNILNNPVSLFRDCFRFVRYPMDHAQVWLFTFGFGLLLTGLYHIFLKITETRNEIS